MSAQRQLGKRKKIVQEELINCPHCEKKLKDRSGLAGHLRLFHGIKVGIKEELRQYKLKIEELEKKLNNVLFFKGDMAICPKCKAALWVHDLKKISLPIKNTSEFRHVQP